MQDTPVGFMSVCEASDLALDSVGSKNSTFPVLKTDHLSNLGTESDNVHSYLKRLF